ncbi:phosphatase PAP2 family protein [Streptomyces phyllanthi]|uniref:phosphatase PAP2 family protein n=1 Tax=Streptomyces phyllanthi TaxID=1803180 RepID=UPI0031EB6EA0
MGDVDDVRGLDRRLLSVVHACGTDPRVAAAARALSRAGDHGVLWLAAGLAGAAADRERRGAWMRATALTAGASLLSMGVKRVVRRPRPAHVAPLVRTVGRHSFPSSHASSAAAAAVAYGALRAPGAGRLVTPLAAAMCVSRLVAGVHYPSDVAVGAALGAVTARLGVRWMTGATAGTVPTPGAVPGSVPAMEAAPAPASGGHG